MEVGILSMRYAKAMIEYAQEKGVEDKLYQEFLTLSYCFCAQPGLREALDNPVISTKRNWRWYVRLPMATVNPPESLSILLLWYCETGVRDIYSLSA